MGEFCLPMTTPLGLSDFDFALPPELIAQHPAAERSGSRLLDGDGRRAGRPDLPRAAGPAARRRPAGRQRHARHQGAPVRRQGERRRGRGAGRARRGRRHGRRAPARQQVAAGRAARSASPTPSTPRCWAAPAPTASLFRLRFPAEPHGAARAPRPRAAAALHRATPTTPTTSAATRRCSPRARARSRRRPRRCTSTRRCSPTLRARGVERAAVTLHVGAGTFQPVRSEVLAGARDAQRVVRGRGRGDGGGGGANPRARRPRRRGRHDEPARARVGAALRSGSGVLGAAAGETDLFITPGFASGSSTCCSPTSTCRRARC